MNPTKEETDRLIRQYEADGDFYKSLGQYNRQIARERIAEYRTPDNGYEQRFYHPNVMQIKNAVKGDDRYLYRKPFPWAVFVALGLFALAGVWIVTEVL